jgi:hypothetical protein
MCSRSPFVYAVKRQPIRVIKFLIQSGANVNQTFGCGHNSTILTVAMRFSTAETVLLLIRSGADPLALSAYDVSPLHSTVALNRSDDETTKMCRVFLKEGIDINCPEKVGHTALHMALKERSSAVVSWLIQQGADVRVVRLLNVLNHGKTDQTQICRGALIMFVKNGGNLFDRDQEGRHAFHPANYDKVPLGLRPTMSKLRSCIVTLTVCQMARGPRSKTVGRLPKELVREVGSFLL